MSDATQKGVQPKDDRPQHRQGGGGGTSAKAGGGDRAGHGAASSQEGGKAKQGTAPTPRQEAKPPVAPEPDPESLFEEEEEFETVLLYRCPGKYQREGGTYSFEPARTAAEREALLADGWHDTLPEAIANAGPEPPKIVRPRRR